MAFSWSSCKRRKWRRIHSLIDLWVLRKDNFPLSQSHAEDFYKSSSFSARWAGFGAQKAYKVTRNFESSHHFNPLQARKTQSPSRRPPLSSGLVNLLTLLLGWLNREIRGKFKAAFVPLALHFLSALASDSDVQIENLNFSPPRLFCF